jgi:flagellar hook-length control protein FliK
VGAARAGAAAALALTTPVSAPEFREALGVQVSVLARNGVQHAQLQLNPAEMGPISVQIAIDGTRAQVDFGADSFATRQIIESGLPELAAALRDAGFTLAGGGVSQHSRGSAGGGEAQPAPAGSAQPRDAAGEAGPAGTRIQLRAPLGAVDLYA